MRAPAPPSASTCASLAAASSPSSSSSSPTVPRLPALARHHARRCLPVPPLLFFLFLLVFPHTAAGLQLGTALGAAGLHEGLRLGATIPVQPPPPPSAADPETPPLPPGYGAAPSPSPATRSIAEEILETGTLPAYTESELAMYVDREERGVVCGGEGGEAAGKRNPCIWLCGCCVVVVWVCVGEG